MNKYKFISLDYIRILLLIFILIYSICLLISPQEVFAMEPHDIIRSFNPDTYIRHEIDGTPIYDSDRYNYHSREAYNKDTYHSYSRKSHYPKIQQLDSKPIYEIDSYPNYDLDPTEGRHELRDTMVDPRTYHGKLHYEAEKAKQLGEISKHKLYTEARNKQRSCGTEHPIYHRKVLDLPKTDCFDDNKKCTIKSIFSKISHFVDNKPSGAMDPR